MRHEPIARPFTADRYERLLAVAAIVLIAVVTLAMARGAGRWGQMSPVVWAHLLTIAVALIVTPIQLLRRRAGAGHRMLGYLWAATLFASAAISFGIREGVERRFSVIHLLSVLVVVLVPLLVWSARDRRFARHRRLVRGLTTGALLTAGFFTLIPGRLLGNWLLG